MNHRVILCDPAARWALEHPSTRVLARLEEVLAVAVADEILLPRLRRGERLELLYFDDGDFDRAAHGLSAKEVEEAVRRRLEVWSSRASGHVAGRLFEAEKRCITWASLALVEVDEDDDSVFERILDASLEVLRNEYAVKRFGHLDLPLLLFYNLLGDSRLIREVGLAVAACEVEGLPAEASFLAEEMAVRTAFAEELAAALNSRGPVQVGFGPLAPSLARGLFVSPRDAVLLERFTSEQRTFSEWRDGVVAEGLLDEVGELESLGKNVVALFLRGGYLTAALSQRSSGELRRDLEEGYERAGLAAEHLALIAALRFDQILLRLALMVTTAAEDASLEAEIGQQFEAERRLLIGAQARHPSTVGIPSDGGQVAAEGLRHHLEGSVEDITFLMEFVRHRPGEPSGDGLPALLTIKSRQLAELAEDG